MLISVPSFPYLFAEPRSAEERSLKDIDPATSYSRKNAFKLISPSIQPLKCSSFSTTSFKCRFSKLRYCIDLNMLKQVYYSLIFPYINYGLMSWGNTYATKLKKVKIVPK